MQVCYMALCEFGTGRNSSPLQGNTRGCCPAPCESPARRSASSVPGTIPGCCKALLQPAAMYSVDLAQSNIRVCLHNTLPEVSTMLLQSPMRACILALCESATGQYSRLLQEKILRTIRVRARNTKSSEVARQTKQTFDIQVNELLLYASAFQMACEKGKETLFFTFVFFVISSCFLAILNVLQKQNTSHFRNWKV